ncbi:MAG: hypothetical protein ACI9R3_002351 [Verrucomicrobiales bacterium]|jgi:hypothetical protein
METPADEVKCVLVMARNMKKLKRLPSIPATLGIFA